MALAGRQTAIYPVASPGGWQLIGHCPVPLFDLRADPPALLAPGDRVRVLPGGQEALVARIVTFDGDLWTVAALINADTPGGKADGLRVINHSQLFRPVLQPLEA